MRKLYGINYLETQEVCSKLSISQSTLKRWRDENKIKFVKLSERIFLYPETGLATILNEAMIPTMQKGESMAIVEMNDGNIIFNGEVFIKELNVATKLGITLESLHRIPNARNIIGPTGQRFYNKRDIDRIFVEGKAKKDPNKKVLKG